MIEHCPWGCGMFVENVGVVKGVDAYRCRKHGLIPADEVEDD